MFKGTNVNKEYQNLLSHSLNENFQLQLVWRNHSWDSSLCENITLWSSTILRKDWATSRRIYSIVWESGRSYLAFRRTEVVSPPPRAPFRAPGPCRDVRSCPERSHASKKTTDYWNWIWDRKRTIFNIFTLKANENNTNAWKSKKKKVYRLQRKNERQKNQHLGRDEVIKAKVLNIVINLNISII